MKKIGIDDAVKPEDKSCVVFFDGVCNLCNAFIDFVIRNDKNKQIFYTSLQSRTAENLLKSYDVNPTQGMTTIYFLEKKVLYSQSTAVLKIMQKLGKRKRFIARFLLLFPRVIRDRAYVFIALNRYRFFGKKQSCRLPSAEEARQFI